MEDHLKMKEKIAQAERPKGFPEDVWESLEPKEKDYFILSRIYGMGEKIIRRMIYIHSDRTYYRFRSKLYEKLNKMFKTFNKE